MIGEKQDKNIYLSKINNVSTRTISRWRKFNPKYPINLNILQKDLIIASVLGKGCITKNGYFKIKIKQEEYKNYFIEILNPFIIHKDPIRTCSHKFFKELRIKWYDNHKTCPKDLVLNNNIVLHWILQSGFNKGKNFILKTKVKSIEILSQKLIQLGLENKIHKNLIYLDYDFVNKIKNDFKCFEHKFERKLDLSLAKEIRNLYDLDNITQEELSKIYKVSRSTITNIVNCKTYIEKPTFALSGECIARIGYKT